MNVPVIKYYKVWSIYNIVNADWEMYLDPFSQNIPVIKD